MFGLPTGDNDSRDDALMANIIACNDHQHDFSALRAVSTRIVIGVGAESGQQLADRAGRAVAERLGIEIPVAARWLAISAAAKVTRNEMVR